MRRSNSDQYNWSVIPGIVRNPLSGPITFTSSNIVDCTRNTALHQWLQVSGCYLWSCPFHCFKFAPVKCQCYNSNPTRSILKSVLSPAIILVLENNWTHAANSELLLKKQRQMMPRLLWQLLYKQYVLHNICISTFIYGKNTELSEMNICFIKEC